MKRRALFTTLAGACLAGGAKASQGLAPAAPGTLRPYGANAQIADVASDPLFVTAEGRRYGQLLFPQNRSYFGGRTLRDLSLAWYTNIRPEQTVAIVNALRNRAAAGDTVFLDIYSPEERRRDPEKEATGLFFFRGKPGARFAIVNAGGGFAYVGAMHDSFPHALALSEMGFNAFALIYRPGAQTACEDLARAIAFVFAHARELQVDTRGYSLWGGSAGARMVAWVGTAGTARFGEKPLPKPAAVIMQYTGLAAVTGQEPPTYACVGREDWIAGWETMQRRIEAIRRNETPAEIEVFDGLSHGFGVGTGTVAEGWLPRAVAFWERQMPPGYRRS